MFQSSPAHVGGRYGSGVDLSEASPEFQSSPAHVGGRYAGGEGVAEVGDVSILARPRGRALHWPG